MLRDFFCRFEKIFSSTKFENFAENIFRLRFFIGAIIFLICIIFEIHGSSIGMYGKFLDHPELNSIIFGEPRQIRSDEYIVFTPFSFSQYFNNFSMISDIVRGTATNMFMTYGQPVWHLAQIFRPALFGYLLFDQGSGFAFFWMGRLIALFLVSFEFARIILGIRKNISFLWAVMVAFSPLAQWWWAVNSIVEILTAGQALAILWKFYLQELSTKRFLYAIGFLWCVGIFIFGIYPAWQVTFGYVFLIILIAVTREFDGVIKTLYRDKIFWLIGLILTFAPIAHAIYSSLDMIEITRATSYPGSRFELSGHMSPLIIFYYGMDLLIPFIDTWQSGGLNNLEFSTFFSMAPLGWIIFFWLTFKKKKFDFIMAALFVLSLVFLLWEIIEFPPFLAKLTLMSNVIGNRARNVIDFANMMMIFRGFALIETRPSLPVRIIIAVSIGIISALALKEFMPAWFGVKKFLAISTFVSLSTFIMSSCLNNFRVIILTMMMLLMGVTINPVNIGVDVVYKMPVGQKIAEIAHEDKSLWIVENDGVWINDFPIMFGAPTINSVNVYPVLERWRKIDPDGKNFERYNRYANMIIVLTAEPTEFIDMGLLDHCKINLNVNDLPKLEARYILSRNGDLEKLSTSSIKLKKIYEDAGSFIYTVAW